MAQRGRPLKLPISDRITNALGTSSDLMVYNSKNLPEKQLPAIDVPPKISEDAQDDYTFARDNLHALLQKGNEILEGVTELAREAEHPRTYEVAGNLLKVLIEGTRELMTLQKDIKDLEKKSALETPTVTIEHADQVNHVVLENTTMEMLEILEAAKFKKKQKELEEMNNG